MCLASVRRERWGEWERLWWWRMITRELNCLPRVTDSGFCSGQYIFISVNQYFLWASRGRVQVHELRIPGAWYNFLTNAIAFIISYPCIHSTPGICFPTALYCTDYCMALWPNLLFNLMTCQLCRQQCGQYCSYAQCPACIFGDPSLTCTCNFRWDDSSIISLTPLPLKMKLSILLYESLELLHMILNMYVFTWRDFFPVIMNA